MTEAPDKPIASAAFGEPLRRFDRLMVDLLEAIAKALGDPLAAFFDGAGARGPLKPGLPAGRKPRGKLPARRKPAATA